MSSHGCGALATDRRAVPRRARPEAERAVFLHEATRDDPSLEEEVAAMLVVHAGSRPLAVESQLMADAVDGSLAARLADSGDVRAGPYRLAERIGRGGMGEVYRAERVDGQYRQTVAVKVIRPGFVTPELLQRFRSERQILALR